VHGVAGAGGGPLVGPEFQILTSVTTFERANFVAEVLGGLYGDRIVVDMTPFISRARDAAALVDYCNLLFLAGRMTPDERAELIAAVRAISITNTTERSRTAVYLTLVIAQFQVER
jgi:hypothetical protein